MIFSVVILDKQLYISLNILYKCIVNARSCGECKITLPQMPMTQR